MKRLLAVFAHPDDEVAIAGTLACYAQMGVHLALVCTTRGESGEISDLALANPENLGSVREAELRCAGEVLGVNEIHFLNYCDSGMKGTPDNDLPTAFIQAEPDEVRSKLVELIRKIRPHVVITFEPNGWYGHPDHIVTGKYATEAFALAGNSTAFPEAGSIWQSQRLYHAVIDLDQFGVIFDYAREHGLDTSDFDTLQMEMEQNDPPIISHSLNKASTRCHKTQYSLDSVLFRVPEEVRRQAARHEHFTQIVPPVTSGKEVVGDLFDDLKIPVG
jgi:N-acetyl-1-D-myo-inositol-2-amino-2-deoxy-alpha-D-glucopyranoside deacetylase/mycothiol S-conjugate amidase